ncbi:MAG TPA: 2-phosphosulfolactate phosphatase [Gemmatimonadaceae bacterium]|nr:2-phosphosulfolactate phosphatase [Gemmatimonadaceae bacterium]
MRIDVHFNGSSTGGQAELHDRVVLVIDVLRASTSIAAALNNGARAVIPFQGVDEAMTRARSLERSDVLLAGERKMVPIRGFDLGNSPGEFTPAVVQGKTIVMTTTNGTAALAGAQGAHEVLVGSFANYSVVVAWLRAAARADKSITLVCAGTDGRFALEDAICAGRFVRGIARRGIEAELGDAATIAAMIDRRMGVDLPAVLRNSEHGRALIEAGHGDDVAYCATLDTNPVVPIYRDRQVVRLGALER